TFPDKKVKAFELKMSDEDAMENALHLDCCFQPVGKDKAIIHKEGFKNEEDYQFLVDFFGRENVFDITKKEMYDMNSNIFSITPDVVVSDERFTRLNKQLREWGMTVEEIPYKETAKMEGLLRCSTLPLKRESHAI
ncbi:MAG: arginine deiminase family protein, partial [Fulvivirga sp.]|nr:arginine deiminase family protein [Fulvivirga sp.]